MIAVAVVLRRIAVLRIGKSSTQQVGVVQRQASVGEAVLVGASATTMEVALSAAHITRRLAIAVVRTSALTIRGNKIPSGGVRDLGQLLGATVRNLTNLLGVSDAIPTESMEGLVVRQDITGGVQFDECITKVAMTHVVDRQIEVLKHRAAEMVEELDQVVSVQTVGDITQDDGAAGLLVVFHFLDVDAVDDAGVVVGVPGAVVVILSRFLRLFRGQSLQPVVEINGILRPDAGDGVESDGEVPSGDCVQQTLVLVIQNLADARRPGVGLHLGQLQLSAADFEAGVDVVDQSAARWLILMAGTVEH